MNGRQQEHKEKRTIVANRMGDGVKTQTGKRHEERKLV